MKSKRKLLNLILILAMLFSPFATSIAGASTADNSTDLNQDAFERANQMRAENRQKGSLEQRQQNLEEKYNINTTVPSKSYQPDDTVRVIIKLSNDAVVEELNRKGQSLQNVSSTDLQTKENRVTTIQSDFLNRIKTNRVPFKGKHQFTYMMNAVSGEVLHKDIDRIKQMSGVEDVWISQEYYPHTNNSTPDMYFSAPLIGSEYAWDSDYNGEGIIVAVLDTGVNYFHPAFGGSGRETITLGGDIDFSAETGNGAGYDNTRVIGGWNHADGNNDIVDRTASQHGVHVAGTVGGFDESATLGGKPFKGVAPKVSILAEKVFSNDPNRPSTLTDEIIAGIEHAVRNGAHVINMSLGSPSGAYVADNPQILAVENAVQQGVVFSVSAGNSGFSTPFYPFASNRDYAMVGSPSISQSTISVAASVNAAALFEAITLSEAVNSQVEGVSDLTDVPMLVASGLPHPNTLAGEDQYELVYVGLGGAGDFVGKDVVGKVALIQRGEYPFATKVQNAADNGAVAAIIFNSPGNAGYVSMGGFTGKEGIPATFILGSHGRTIASHLEQDTLSVQFNDEPVVSQLAEDTMTDFSSWGPEPGLNFKPTLTAPGGNIYSSVGANEYGGMSGTSMSAPHVAGASALVIESFIKEGRYASYTPNDVKVALANTSTVLINPDTDTPYSVRHQGAGRIQVDQAVKSNILVTDMNDEFGVALKEINDQTVTFTLKAKNISDEEVTFSLAGDVYQDALFESFGLMFNSLTLQEVAGANVSFNNQSVTVPANGEAEITVTVQLPDGFDQNQFVEGWVYLTTEEDQGHPDLVVPYFGFYGDWNQPPVIDDHWANEDTSYYWLSGLYYQGQMWDPNTQQMVPGNIPLGEDINGEYNEEFVGFNPSGYEQNHALPALTLLRNARSLDVSIVDASGQTLRSLSKSNHLRKNSANPYVTYFPEWDGTVNGTVVADGQYYIKAVVQPYGVENRTQEYLYPVKIDTQAPQIEATLSTEVVNETRTLQISGLDEGTGVWGYIVMLYDPQGQRTGRMLEAQQEGNLYHASAEIPADTSYIRVYSWDHAGNYTSIEVGDQIPFILNGYSVNSYLGTVMVYWQSSEEVTHVRFTVNEEDPLTIEEIQHGYRVYNLDLNYGNHVVVVEALNGEEVVATKEFNAIGINMLRLDMAQSVTVTSNQETTAVPIKFEIGSPRVSSVEVALTGSDTILEEIVIDQVGKHTYSFDAPKGESNLVLVAYDEAGTKLGESEVAVTHIKQYDVRLDKTVYIAEDTDEVQVTIAAGEDVARVTFNVLDVDGNLIGTDATYDLTNNTQEHTVNVSAFEEGQYIFVANAYNANDELLDTFMADVYVFVTGALDYNGEASYVRTNQESYTLNWGYDLETISEDISELSLLINGNLAGDANLVPGDTSYTVDLSNYGDGDRLDIVISAGSNNGNEGKLHFTILKDLMAPEWTFNTPEVFEVFNKENRTANITAWTYDMDLDPTSVTLKVPGMSSPASVVPLDLGFAYYLPTNITLIEDGIYNIELKYSDVAGNAGYHHRKVIADFTAPVITVNTPSVSLSEVQDDNGNVTHSEGTISTTNSSITLSGLVSDSLTGVNLWVNDNQVVAANPGKAWTNEDILDEQNFSIVVTLNNGLNEIVLQAVDGAGNIEKIVLKVTRQSSGGTTDPTPGPTPGPTPIPPAPPTLPTPDESKEELKENEPTSIKLNNGLSILVPVGAIGLEKASVKIAKSSSEETEDLLATMKLESGFKSYGEYYNFNILNENGDIVKNPTFDKPVTVVIPVTELNTGDLNKEKLSLFRLNDDGSVTQIGGRLIDGNLVVELHSFSRYIVMAKDKKFEDVSISKLPWAAKEIEVLASKNIINGKTETKYAPTDQVTRAEFTSLLVRTLGLTSKSDVEVTFSDVNTESWYYDAVKIAVSNGLVTGKTETTFAPNDNISRAEMAVIIGRAIKNLGIEGTTEDVLSNFTDSNSIQSWATESVALVVQTGIIKGKDNNRFAGYDLTTRAEAAVVIYRLFNEEYKK